MGTSSIRILVSGGGTGGHIYPALSIIEALAGRGEELEFLYVGTRQGLEADLVPRLGIPFHEIEVRGLMGKSAPDLVRGMWSLVQGSRQALAVLRGFRPDVVVGTGGYVSGPICCLAALMGVPVLIQEQNAFPGLTNRWLSRWARIVALPFEDARRHFPPRAQTMVTGNPVRREIADAGREAAREQLGLDPQVTMMLIMSGSRGARLVNEAAAGMLRALAGLSGLEVYFITGRDHYQRVLELLGSDWGEQPRIHVRPYVHEMAQLLAAADLVVARAGGVTLAEITVRGLPSILVPSPHVTHNHQEANAEVLRRNGAALVIREEDLTAARLQEAVSGLLSDPISRAEMASRARELGRPDAAKVIAGLVIRLALTKHRQGTMSPGPDGHRI